MKTIKLFSITSAIAGVLLAGSTVGALAQTALYVDNASFELPAAGKISTGFDVSGKDVPGWMNCGSSYSDSGIEGSGSGNTGSYAAYCKGGEAGAYQITTNTMVWGKKYTLTWYAAADYVGSSSSQRVGIVSADATNTPFASCTALGLFTGTISAGQGWGQSSLTFIAGNAQVGKYIGMDFSDTADWVKFDDFALTVQDASPAELMPAITTQPVGTNVAPGQSIALAVVATGPDLTYQWKAGVVGSGTYTNLPGATNSALTIPSATTTNTADYVVVITNSAGSVTSAPPAVVNVAFPPWMVATNSTTTNSMGFNFLNATGPGMANGQPASLAQSETAGVPSYAQTNWNNLAKSGATFTGNFTLTNSLGAPTPLIIDWAGNSTGSSGTAAGLGTPDGKLMDGMLTSGNPTTNIVGTNVINSPSTAKPLVYLSGLQAWYQAQGAEGFGVVVYENADGGYDTTFAWVQSVTGSPTNNTMAGGADLTPRLYNVRNSQFNGTYIQIPNTATNYANRSFGANYSVFSGLTNNAVLIRSGDTNESWGAGSMNGFQIVPIFATAPTVSTPTFSPASPVYSGVPVTVTEVATGDAVHPALYYQWLTDGGSGGSLTNMPGTTNSTVTLTPASSGSSYVIQFQVIVTNFMGSVTSSVASLTVNPGAPVLNHDISPSGNVYAYVNGGLTFTANFNGSQPMTYQWATSSSYPLTGATNTTLNLTNLQLSVDDGTYQLLATNAIGNNTSSAATLTVLADPAAPDASQAYAYAVFTNNPVAYWRFSETLDNAANSVQAYDYSGNNHNATYGLAAYDNQVGPQSPTFPGFESTNTCVGMVNSINNSFLTAPSLNLNTNTVTVTAWIKPTGAIGGYWGLFTWLNGSDKAGFGFGGNVSNNVAELGYAWNSNSPSTWGFHSDLYPPLDQWSFVALTITPTNTTIYLYYTDGSSVTNLSKAVQIITNQAESFSGGTIWIGSDSSSGRNFNGYIDDMAVFNKSLSESQIQAMFQTGAGISGVAPYITSDISANPTNTSVLFPGQVPVQLTAAGAGAPTPAYQWQAGTGGVFTNLMSGGSLSGANSGTLTIDPVSPANYLNYRLVLTNIYGSATSSVYAVSQAFVPGNGVWTACYQVTNSGNSDWAWGSGRYTGSGILGHGGFWNTLGISAFWSPGTATSATDYMDDGSTHSGITCTMTGTFLAGGGAAYPSSDRRTLLSQEMAVYGYSTNAIVLNAVPNGTYNLAFIGTDGQWCDRGATFVVHGANGDQTNATANNGGFQYFMNVENAVIVTNVVVSGGKLNVDMTPTSPVPQHDPNGEGEINGLEVQLVSYAPPTAGFSASPTNAAVNQSVTFLNTASPVTNLFWNFGDGNTLNTTVNGNVTHAYSTAGTYTVSQTVKNQGGTASVTNVAYITVTSTTPPVIGHVGMSGGSLVLGGTGGTSGQQYRILTSTNVALPLASWMPVWTNVFAPDGSFSYTNSSPTNGASFFIMVTP